MILYEGSVTVQELKDWSGTWASINGPDNCFLLSPDEMDAICEAWQGHRKSEETPNGGEPHFATTEDVYRIVGEMLHAAKEKMAEDVLYGPAVPPGRI